jgi:hypothetical protein
MPISLPRLLLYSTVLLLVAVAGLAHGLLTDRWAPPDSSVELERLPLTIGEWDASTIELNREELPQIDNRAMLLRRYVNRASGAAVTVFLTCGRPGPIVSSHAPDSCYPGAGFRYASPMTMHSVEMGPDAPEQKFRLATFSKTERASPLYVRIFWAYSGTGAWDVPRNPRLAFARHRRVYKLYVIRQLTRPDEPVNEDPAQPFIRLLLPELDRTFFSGT